VRKKIHVSVSYGEDVITVSSQDDTIELHTSSSVPVNRSRQDFAVWLFLPIAMRLNADLHIEGSGTSTTIANAVKMSQIWSMWMPSHFTDVQITFNDLLSPDPAMENYNEDTLCFYSGGVDSTYCISKRSEYNNAPSLLTVHGMDYSYNDENKFNHFIEKTAPFANLYGNKRLFVKTNAYDTYHKHKVNTKKSHVSHIFALAACGFLYSGYFKKIIIAADYRLDQQFLVFPWGSNSATNFLFDDGITSLITENDDMNRSEKMPFFMNSETTLQSLTFCSNKKNRPHNCGVCPKCTRTKLMFLASTGVVPDIFTTKDIGKDPFKSLNITKASEQAFITDLYYCAKDNGRLNLIPNLESFVEKIRNFKLKQNRVTRLLQMVKLI
jgi:hypothetical protein